MIDYPLVRGRVREALSVLRGSARAIPVDSSATYVAIVRDGRLLGRAFSAKANPVAITGAIERTLRKEET